MKKLCFALVLGAYSFAPANAGQVLIINGSSFTSEPNTTSSITTQLQTLHTAVGNVVTISDVVPDDISSYAQVWDIRFDAAISSAIQSQYVDYLGAGGGMFVMGENSSFMARNDTVLSLISAAGGGSLNFTTPMDVQTVSAPFDGPNAVTTVDYSAPGGVDGFGSGQWITSTGSEGTGVAWGVGALSNAAAGALTVIFDVNFMQTDANAGSQALTKNLIGFVGDQVDPPTPPVPEPASWAMMIAGMGLIGASMRRRAARVAFA